MLIRLPVALRDSRDPNAIAGFFKILLHSALVVSKIQWSHSCFNKGLCSKNEGIEKNRGIGKIPLIPNFLRGNVPISHGHSVISIMPRVFLLLAVGLLFFLTACTTTHYDLSALPTSFPSGTVIVSLDTWHAMLAFPVPSQDVPQHGEQEYEEWGYAERAWYVEGRTGLSGIFRALLWPTDGVVEVGRHPTIWAERTLQPPAEVFVLTLEPESYRHLRMFLESTRLSRTALASFGDSDFFPSVRSYHLFHTCHQYAAHALQAGGLPLTPALALNRTMLGWQLRRIPQPCGEC